MTDKAFIACGKDLENVQAALAFMLSCLDASVMREGHEVSRILDDGRVTQARIKRSTLMRQDLEAVIANKDDPHYANDRAKAWNAIREAVGGTFLGGVK